jgi:hypothetical protein
MLAGESELLLPELSRLLLADGFGLAPSFVAFSVAVSRTGSILNALP